MKVFISWSGELSHKVAEVFREWLKNVIQQLDPFLSSGDIGAGTVWNHVLRTELQETNYGLVCLTETNWREPWINFEAGCLAKSLKDSRCMTFLVNLKQKDIVGPLSQFNHTSFEKEGVKKMMVGLNAACTPCLSEVQLSSAFEMWWPRLRERLEIILNEAPSTDKRERRSSDEILEELLELARRQDRRYQSSYFSYDADGLRQLHGGLLDILSAVSEFEEHPTIFGLQDPIAGMLALVDEMRSKAEQARALKVAAGKLAKKHSQET